MDQDDAPGESGRVWEKRSGEVRRGWRPERGSEPLWPSLLDASYVGTACRSEAVIGMRFAGVWRYG